MALKQQLELRLQQRLAPQQVQFIRLMELNNLELEERVKQEIIDNPALDEVIKRNDGEDDSPSKEDIATNDEDGSNEDISLGDYFSEDDIPDYKISQYENDHSEGYKGDIPFLSDSSIQEHLFDQLAFLELSDIEEKIAEYIIGNIDDDGYLRRPLQMISDDLIFQAGLDIDVYTIEKVLDKIKEFDPAGVAATSLQECLMLQLERLESSEENVIIAKEIITNHFDDFSKKHYDRIGKALGLDKELLKKVIKTLTQLNPRPGNTWNSSFGDTYNQISPDIFIEENNGEVTFSLNDCNIPELRVNQKYIDMYKDYTSNKANQTKETRETLLFVRQKLDSAQWFIESVKQRQITLSNIMAVILSIQKDFLITGDDRDLRPMILKDIAEVTNYDISTVSRVLNGKYMQTRYGVYSLKHLFSESLQTNDGEEVSSKEVKKILVDIIENEDKKQPLSDNEICAILCEKGYKIARRTVAKYREQNNIPIARLRKEL